MSQLATNRPLGVSIPKGQNEPAEETQYAPGTVLGVLTAKEYMVEFVGQDGKRHRLMVHIANDQVIYHPASEGWMKELKRLPVELEKAILQHVQIHDIQQEPTTGGHKLPIVPKKEAQDA